MGLHPINTLKKIYTISEITNDIKSVIEDNFHNIWLKGEVSNFKSYASGHYYFTLKDENAQISAVMFKGNNRLLKFALEDGLSVIAHGKISVYEVRGQYQIIIDNMEPEGIGALQLAFEQLKEKLSKEGLFDEERKRELPMLPQKIGIVTSLHGAAVHDMMTVLKRRFDNIEILVYPVKVQGEGSAEEIMTAINYFSKNNNVDVLIVGRGGGSLEDLWSFNEEIVARAIANCSMPVISAVGHETDFSISDFVADLRAPTPSAAAELCVPVKDDLIDDLQTHQERLLINIQSLIKHKRHELYYLVKSLPTPQTVLERLQMRLSDYEEQVYRHMERMLLNFKHNIHNLKTKVELLSPKSVLKRGYLIAKDQNGHVLTRKNQFKPGSEIDLVVYDGEVKSKILPPLN